MVRHDQWRAMLRVSLSDRAFEWMNMLICSEFREKFYAAISSLLSSVLSLLFISDEYADFALISAKQIQLRASRQQDYDLR